jgi:hypothetical protein
MSSEDQITVNGHQEDPVGRLLKLAGEPKAVPAERMERSREMVRAHWQKTSEKRKQPRVRAWSAGAMAMAASLAAAVFLLNWFQTPETFELARIARVSGQLSLHEGGIASSIMGSS